MYILIVSRGYPTEKYPLNGIFEFDQAKALHNFGHKIVYISLDLRSIRRVRRFGKCWVKKEGIDILSMSIPLGPFPENILSFIGKLALKNIYGDIIKKHGKPEIIHAHFSGIGFMATILKDQMRVPLVITEHGSNINKPHLNKKRKKRAIEAYKNSDRLISVSSNLGNIIQNHFNIKSEIVHNIVDTNSFNFVKRDGGEIFNYISVGNLIQGKGFNTLINAFYKAGFGENVKLIIIGDGPEYNNLQKQISDLDLNNKVQLLGFMEREDISKVMHKSNAFVLASRSETFGVVYIEALATGLPVIATSCGGPEDFINNQNGILVPVDDINKLAKALNEMYVSIDRFDRKLISEECKRNFSPDIIASKLTEIFQGVLSEVTRI